MELRPQDLEALRAELARGSIQTAYSAIIGYMSQLRARYSTSEWPVSGLYQGQFDMTYFALFPPVLKSRDLKLAIVFDYAAFGFEVWLAARNRAVQKRYWKLLDETGWSGSRLVKPAPGVDAIVVAEVASADALLDPDSLSLSIEAVAGRLVADLEGFLAVHDRGAV